VAALIVPSSKSRASSAFSAAILSSLEMGIAFGPQAEDQISARGPCEQSSAVWISVRAGQNPIVLRETSAFGTLLPLQQAAIDAALNAARQHCAFRSCGR
jgi:hypothetical protein